MVWGDSLLLPIWITPSQLWGLKPGCTWLRRGQHEGRVWGLLKAPLAPRKFTASTKKTQRTGSWTPELLRHNSLCDVLSPQVASIMAVSRSTYFLPISSELTTHVGETKGERKRHYNLFMAQPQKARSLKSTIFYLSPSCILSDNATLNTTLCFFQGN